MLTPSKLGCLLIAVAGVSLILANSGCGELVSGANLKPTVKYRLDLSAASVEKTEDAAKVVGVEGARGGVGTLKGKVVYNGAFSPLPPLHEKGRRRP